MHLNLKQKILLALLTIGFIPIIAISIEAITISSSAIQEKAEEKALSAKEIKKGDLERFFDTIGKQAVVLADNPNTIDAMFKLEDAFKRFSGQVRNKVSLSDARNSVTAYWKDEFGKKYQQENGQSFDFAKLDQLSDVAWLMQNFWISENTHPLGEKNALVELAEFTTYSGIHGKYHAWFDKYIAQFGYYDLFLVNNGGEIVYSVFKELDFATSLLNGPWKDTGIAEVFKKANGLKQGELYFTDIAVYGPSYEAPAQFVATPIFDEGTQEGILILQIPVDKIGVIMSDRSGMGETGETYLVGSDKLMRSDSYLSADNFSVKSSLLNPSKFKVDTLAVEKALSGETGTLLTENYLGDEVISSFSPVKIAGKDWAIIAEINQSEALAKVNSMTQLIMITALVIVVITILFGLIFSSRLTKPIIELSDRMNKIGDDFNFDQRCEYTSRDEIGKASQAFNNLIQNTNHAMKQVNETMVNISNGDFSSRVTANLKGDLGQLKQSVNDSAQSVEVTMDALGNIMDAMSQGNFKARMGNEIKGEFKQRVDTAMSRMDLAISEIGEVIGKLSQGEFDSRVEAQLEGDLNVLKENINSSLGQLGSAMKEINQVIVAQSNSDLSMNVTGDYHGELSVLKQALNLSAQNLNNVLSGVVTTSQSVARASQEVASGSMDLNDRTQAQAASLEQTAASMEELTSTIQQNASHAAEADRLSENAKQQAVHGLAVMSESVEAIKEIHESSAKIEEIISLIDSIAFQTNLLALNAAVEAARAGEHGRGFAVVAGEVRSLAGKSADAARDIKALIDNTVSKIDEGTAKINRTGDSLQTINDSVIQVSEIISEIATASQEQQRGIEQVNVAVTQIDQTTQQNAALVEQTTAASEALSGESDRLSQSVSQFNLVKSLH